MSGFVGRASARLEVLERLAGGLLARVDFEALSAGVAEALELEEPGGAYALSVGGVVPAVAGAVDVELEVGGRARG